MFQYLYSAPGTGASQNSPHTSSTRQDGEAAALKTVCVFLINFSLCHDSGPRPVPAHAPCGKESPKVAPGHELPVPGMAVMPFSPLLSTTGIPSEWIHHNTHTQPVSVHAHLAMGSAIQGPDERHSETPEGRK